MPKVTLAAHVSNVVAAAQARGVTNDEALGRIRQDAIDYWRSRIQNA